MLYPCPGPGRPFQNQIPRDLCPGHWAAPEWPRPTSHGPATDRGCGDRGVQGGHTARPSGSAGVSLASAACIACATSSVSATTLAPKGAMDTADATISIKAQDERPEGPCANKSPPRKLTHRQLPSECRRGGYRRCRWLLVRPGAIDDMGGNAGDAMHGAVQAESARLRVLCSSAEAASAETASSAGTCHLGTSGGRGLWGTLRKGAGKWARGPKGVSPKIWPSPASKRSNLDEHRRLHLMRRRRSLRCRAGGAGL